MTVCKMNDITFPPTKKIVIDDATMKRLLAEGMEFRKAIEKSCDRMNFIRLEPARRIR